MHCSLHASAQIVPANGLGWMHTLLQKQLRTTVFCNCFCRSALLLGHVAIDQEPITTCARNHNEVIKHPSSPFSCKDVCPVVITRRKCAGGQRYLAGELLFTNAAVGQVECDRLLIVCH